jgi:hypothetical protein
LSYSLLQCFCNMLPKLDRIWETTWCIYGSHSFLLVYRNIKVKNSRILNLYILMRLRLQQWKCCKSGPGHAPAPQYCFATAHAICNDRNRICAIFETQKIKPITVNLLRYRAAHFVVHFTFLITSCWL